MAREKFIPEEEVMESAEEGSEKNPRFRNTGWRKVKEFSRKIFALGAILAAEGCVAPKIIEKEAADPTAEAEADKEAWHRFFKDAVYANHDIRRMEGHIKEVGASKVVDGKPVKLSYGRIQQAGERKDYKIEIIYSQDDRKNKKPESVVVIIGRGFEQDKCYLDSDGDGIVDRVVENDFGKEHDLEALAKMPDKDLLKKLEGEEKDGKLRGISIVDLSVPDEKKKELGVKYWHFESGLVSNLEKPNIPGSVYEADFKNVVGKIANEEVGEEVMK